MSDISSISEFELIERLNNIIVANSSSNFSSENIILGIGDDAAVVTHTGKKEVVTTDTMVENTHFVYETVDFRDLGWKSLATNYSDIAAMGCTPFYSVVNLGLRPTQKISDIEDIYKGLCDLTNEMGGAIIGGDIVKSDTFFISITVTGFSENDNILTRNGAQVGDYIFVTGHLGCSKAGLEIILNTPERIDLNENIHFMKSHTRPTPRVKEGLELSNAGITTAMDISDGLLNDLKKMCDSSKVGANIFIESLPADDHLKNRYPEKWDEMVISGGEDYELLFTANTEMIFNLNDFSNSELISIGKITERNSGLRILDSHGNLKTYSETGWDHFKDK
jgi:thiamine-monophosphate kinase